ncbi:MAG: CBS domain-containing protein [Agriterribacter sp.]
MRTVANIFQRKGRHNITITPDVTVLQALKIMSEKNIGSVIVVDFDGRYCGLATERDYARKVILLGKSSSDTPVSEIMLEHLPKVTPDHTLEDCMEIMTAHNIRYLPVFADNEFYGVVSVLDIVKETILAQQETIDQLHNYIHSTV